MKKFLAVVTTIFLIGMQMTPIKAAESTEDKKYNYVDAFSKSILFYEANWCGADAGNNRLKWRGPCHEEDGKDVGLDLTGGFHDAGDHVKFGLPQAYAASTLGWAYYEFKDSFVKKGQDKYMLNILKHFTDYFLKCYPNKTTFYYQCGDGTTDHSYWGPPELQTPDITSRPTLYAATPEKPASDVCGSTAAALAIMYLNYKDIDTDYANKCLTAAKNLYDFGKTYKGLSQSGGFYGSTGYWDDLSWGAVWLYSATNDNSYINDIDSFLTAKGIGGDNTYANHWTQCWDDVFGGVFVRLAEVTNNAKYKSIAEENLNYWIKDAPTTKGGLKYIASWGTLRYTAAECMLALVYYKYSNNKDYLDFAKSQIDYILGSNPRNSSYEVGFGNNYPKYPHHRAASGRMEGAPGYEKKTDPEKHLLYGALVGGPDGTSDDYSDDVNQYVNSEVAIDYNAGFVGALAGMSNYYGGEDLPEAIPGIEANTPQYYVEANVMKESNEECTIQAFMHNDSLLPPHYEKGLSFRYYVDLSELYKNGYTAADVAVRANYAAGGGSLSGLIPYDEAKHIYYVEASWPNQLYGKAEMQFAITAYNAKCLDASNDFSRQNLKGDSNVTSENIPVYRNGVKIFGNEPGESEVKAGDVNGDGVVNGRDLMELRRYLAGNNNNINLKAADLNGDGIVNGRDLMLLTKLISSSK
ncbi:glycoside hydrolase family 9 protein [Clostridium felsineum]|uniref:glycoside hydrolase family 9 protein n=1 Tax=Clostridium felsineum TaxID=36839 RepID=UPI00098BE8D8|nr:glycoside hydrolase family 9 protein [Clostridium felsineum]URZ15509.1 Endoglucanase 1 [Clostridium felsineum DSM 794]